MVWGQQLSQWGHVAICSGEGNTSWFNSWDNNWTGNHDATTKIKHDYNGVLGVLRPYNQEPITGKKDVDDSTPAAAPSENNNVTNPIKVIDISEYQTNVNYAKLAKEVDGVIIRVGYRGWGSSGDLVTDSMFKTHL
jgi:GH25 family lysozyme M1 (1,4-beta-N-acetylmuramidase)